MPSRLACAAPVLDCFYRRACLARHRHRHRFWASEGQRRRRYVSLSREREIDRGVHFMNPSFMCRWIRLENLAQ
jgi:hypothetical protein